MNEEVRYRWIDGPTATVEEWDHVDEILAMQGWSSLNRPTSRVLVAEDKEGIAGLICLQLYPHTEPLYVRPAYRGTGLAEELADRMYAFMRDVQARGFMVVADSPYAEKLCKERGMTKVESPVYIMR